MEVIKGQMCKTTKWTVPIIASAAEAQNGVGTSHIVASQDSQRKGLVSNGKANQLVLFHGKRR